MSEVEKIAGRRRFALMIMGSAFLIWQVPLMDYGDRLIAEGDVVKTGISLAGFAVWIAMLLFLVGPWRYRGEHAAALNDELTRANRAKAFLAGYVVMLIAAAGLLALSLYLPVSGIEAAHIILVAGVVVPIYAFAFLERA